MTRTFADFDPELYDRLEALGLDRIIADDPVPSDPMFWRGVLMPSATPTEEEEIPWET